MRPLRVVCPSPRCGSECDCCGGLGYLDVHTVKEPPQAVSACCGAPWQPSADPAAWKCSKCGCAADRRVVAGW